MRRLCLGLAYLGLYVAQAAAQTATSRVGVVALANTSGGEGTTDIGQHLLDARYPLWVPDSSPTREPTLEAKVLDGYIGHYELLPTAIFAVTREGEQLYAQLTSQPRAAVFPKSNTEFYYKVVDAQITFETDPQGSLDWRILLDADGKVAGEVLNPLP